MHTPKDATSDPTRSLRAAASHVPTSRGSVAVIGLGYVGLPLAILAESKGYRVSGFDIDPIKTTLLARREAGFLSDEESRLFK
jgi:UDP-N-acetyl-D-glucosamine dehydrogenase